MRDLDEAMELANEFAPEPLCLSVADPRALTGKACNAGGLFLGEHSSERETGNTLRELARTFDNQISCVYNAESC